MKPKNLMLIMSLPLLGYACNNLGGRPMPKDDTGVHVLDTGEADTDTDTDADTDTDTDTDTDPHYSSLQAPAYVVSSLVFAEFLESESFNLIVSQIFDGSFPPESDDIVLIWDPIGEVEGQDWFQAEFGVGDVVEPVDAGEFDFPETSNTLTLDYAVTGDDSFASTNTGITMQLGEVGGFGFSFALYNAGIEGQFQFDHLYIDGSIFSSSPVVNREGTFSIRVDSTTLADGPHVLHARLSSDDGRVLMESVDVTILVKNGVDWALPERILITERNITVTIGSTHAFTVTLLDENGEVVPLPETHVVRWSLEGEIGTILPDGTFIAEREGAGWIQATI